MRSPDNLYATLISNAPRRDRMAAAVDLLYLRAATQCHVFHQGERIWNATGVARDYLLDEIEEL